MGEIHIIPPLPNQIRTFTTSFPKVLDATTLTFMFIGASLHREDFPGLIGNQFLYDRTSMLRKSFMDSKWSNNDFNIGFDFNKKCMRYHE